MSNFKLTAQQADALIEGWKAFDDYSTVVFLFSGTEFWFPAEGGIRAMIGGKNPQANEALWNGDFALARRYLLSKGLKRYGQFAKERKNFLKEECAVFGKHFSRDFRFGWRDRRR